jgi:hypothetical protein
MPCVSLSVNRLRENPNLEVVPRTYFFAGAGGLPAGEADHQVHQPRADYRF